MCVSASAGMCVSASASMCVRTVLRCIVASFHFEVAQTNVGRKLISAPGCAPSMWHIEIPSGRVESLLISRHILRFRRPKAFREQVSFCSAERSVHAAAGTPMCGDACRRAVACPQTSRRTQTRRRAQTRQRAQTRADECRHAQTWRHVVMPKCPDAPLPQRASSNIGDDARDGRRGGCIPRSDGRSRMLALLASFSEAKDGHDVLLRGEARRVGSLNLVTMQGMGCRAGNGIDAGFVPGNSGRSRMLASFSDARDRDDPGCAKKQGAWEV